MSITVGDDEWRVHCNTVKMKAVLMPNSNIPSVDSHAPIIRQSGSSINPEAPRLVMETTE
jgi:hypothetical protein